MATDEILKLLLAERAKIDNAIKALGGESQDAEIVRRLNAGRQRVAATAAQESHGKTPAKKAKHGMSAEARAKISAAAKARWAKVKKAEKKSVKKAEA